MPDERSPGDMIPDSNPQQTRLLPTSSAEVEILLKGLAVLGLLLYVVGLVAVNAYLFSLDVTDFSLARPRFVYTGVLFAALMILPYLLGRDVYRWLHNLRLRRPSEESQQLQQQQQQQQQGQQPQRSDFAGSLAVLAVLILLGIFVAAFTVGVEGNRGLPTWISMLVAVLPLSALGAVACAVLELSVQSHGRITGALLTAITLLALASLAFFVRLTYGKVPEQFGGGRPSHVRLLFVPGAAARVQELGIMLCSGNPDLSGRVGLLYEAPDDYVIGIPLDAIPPQRVVRLRKDMVSAVIAKQSGALAKQDVCPSRG